MITFTQLGRYGRLGNQLFQYAALRALSLKKGYQIKIPNPAMMQWHGQNCLLGNFQLQRAYLTNLQVIKGFYNQPDYMKFDPKFFDVSDDHGVYGFFQSILYFKQFERQIKRQLTPKRYYLTKSKVILDKIRRQNPGFQIVSLHLRRGDNVDFTNSNRLLNTSYDNGFYDSYFQKARVVFSGKKVKFLVFTGGARNSETNQKDINWCKSHFTGSEYLFSQNDSMTDFCLMMQCDHNIISHVSSFGWWAAYLNRNQNKIVVAPLHYHPDMPSCTYRQGFYPQEYVIV